MGNDCWYYRAQYAGMTKVCMRTSSVERGRIVRFGLCPISASRSRWAVPVFTTGRVGVSSPGSRNSSPNLPDPDDDLFVLEQACRGAPIIHREMWVNAINELVLRLEDGRRSRRGMRDESQTEDRRDSGRVAVILLDPPD